MVSFWESFSGKWLPVAHSLYYIVCKYNTVGWSIASIYDLGSIFTSGCIRISAIDLPTVLRIYQAMIYYLSHTLLYYIICQLFHHCTHIRKSYPSLYCRV